MMQYTDRNYRSFMRLITRHTLLYTEMVTTHAILRGDRAWHLNFSAEEAPIALQLGGDDPKALAECARIAADWGYTEINLNVGCPSSKVQSGAFGAVLMKTPERVAEAVAAMRAVVDLPVTVKHRIGVDELDHYDDMLNFVDVVSAAGADRFTVHARKAWLQGLSPKQNRTVPPLRHEDVWRLKAERGHLPIEINGGIKDLDTAATHLEHVDAVMIGRAAYDQPYLFAQVDPRFFGQPAPSESRDEVIEGLIRLAERHVATGSRLHHLARHTLGLFTGVPGGRRWRRVLGTGASDANADASLIREAAEAARAVRL